MSEQHWWHFTAADWKLAGLKNTAHRQLSYAIRTRKLIKQPCKICGAKKVHGHHPDYSKPLDVIWLCRFHHVQVHKEMGSYRKPKVSSK